jgi:DNA processing protein
MYKIKIMDENLKYKIAISLIPNIGDILAKRLVSYCGGVEAVFKEKKGWL